MFLNFFISSKRFLWHLCISSIKEDLYHIKIETPCALLSYLYAFISFSFLIVPANISSTILNKERVCTLGLILILMRTMNFSSFSIILAEVSFDVAIIILRCAPSIPYLFTTFIMKGYNILSKNFSASSKMTI